MSTPSVIRIERPYATEDDYVEGDAWTVDRADMILVGVEGVTLSSTFKFQIVLTSGATVVSGEGRAVEVVPARDGRSGGTRVRFRQLDARSKGVLRKALEAQKKALTTASPAVRVDAPPTLPLPHLDASRPEVPPPSTRSGVRHRTADVVLPPENREALLERLRRRAEHTPVVVEDGPRRTATK